MYESSIKKNSSQDIVDPNDIIERDPQPFIEKVYQFASTPKWKRYEWYEHQSRKKYKALKKGLIITNGHQCWSKRLYSNVVNPQVPKT